MTERGHQRVLLITRNLPPLVGGMERLNWHMAQELARIVDLRIIGPVGSAEVAPAGVEVLEVPLSPLRSFLWHAVRTARREARRWCPDIVLAGSGLTAPHALLAARLCGAVTVAYVHGLDIAVRHPIYRALWLPAIRRLDRIVANSLPTAALCGQAGIEASRIGVVHPGVSLPKKPDASAVASFRQRQQLGNRSLLLSIGRLSARKGLREFVAKTLPDIVAAVPDVLLVIIGDIPNQALHAESQTVQSIKDTAQAVGVADHLRFLGKVNDLELRTAYDAASVHVFPVRDVPGDPEGFGMVAVEAAAHGLPTVAYGTGGVVDAVLDGYSGRLIPAGDTKAFARAVVELLRDDKALMYDACRAFAQNFSWDRFGSLITNQLGLGTGEIDP